MTTIQLHGRHNQKKHGNRRAADVFEMFQGGNFTENPRTIATTFNRVNSVADAVGKNKGRAVYMEERHHSNRRITISAGGNNAIHFHRRSSDPGEQWKASTGNWSGRTMQFGTFSDRRQAMSWANRVTKATHTTVNRVPSIEGVGTLGVMQMSYLLHARHVELSEGPIDFYRPLRPEEEVLDLNQMVNRLESGKNNLLRITRNAREDWATEIADKVRSARTPDAISEISIANSKPVIREISREMRSLFQFGGQMVEFEFGHMALRDEPPEQKEIRELFLARARIQTDRMTQQIENAARDFAENMWRTLGPDGITVQEIDQMIEEIITVADREGRKIASRNVSESFNLGRHHKAMANLHRISHCIYSAIMDGNTCPTCDEVDGTISQPNSEQYYSILPPHRNCYGRGACRCIFVYILNEEVPR